MEARTFEDSAAVRKSVPALIGLVGPSGSGKTYSALRLATGIQRFAGGDIGFIDTEARRSLHYADVFKFRHLPFGAPFGPLDYLTAIEHFSKKGVKTIIVDSMSHEHEGPGGVLEMHERKLDELAGNDWGKRERTTFLAWAEPKAQRRRLINSILQMDCNLIFCFRAKEKIKIVRGQQPQQLGWMPIAGEEFVYEMTMCCLLYPGGGGVPVWQPGEVGEQQMVKLPSYFRELMAKQRPLDEDTGEAIARWASGGTRVSDEGKEPIEAFLDVLDKGGVVDKSKWITETLGRLVSTRRQLHAISKEELAKLSAMARAQGFMVAP